MRAAVHAGAPWAFIGLATVATLMLIATVTGVRGVVPTWAGEAENGAALELDARWRSFAADLASASGCAVRYESPLRGDDDMFRPEARAWDDHGAVGMLRIGAANGPAVLVMPTGFLESTEASVAFERSGLKEPRRLAQDLVAGAAFSKPGEEPGPGGLGELLATRAVLIPVCLAEGTRRGEGLRSRSRSGSPARNFPVRWEEAARVAPRLAGPYPASHPGVRALTAWLNSTPDCAALLRITPKASSGPPMKTFAAGTLEAFCSEVLGLSVRMSPADGCMAAIEEALLACGALSLTDVKWTRLGAENWSLEVTVTQRGGVQSGGRPVLLATELVGGGVSLTAAAASVVTDDGASMELLPLRKQGLLLDSVSQGKPCRVRLFLSGGADHAAATGQGRLGAAEPGAPLQVVLTASSSRTQRGSIRTKSPD